MLTKTCKQTAEIRKQTAVIPVIRNYLCIQIDYLDQKLRFEAVCL